MNPRKDLRKDVRYTLQVPVLYTWKNMDRNEQHLQGRTRDISVSGAFIWAAVCPPEGMAVKVDMVLALVPDAVRSLRLNATGRVVRCEQPASEGAMGGFAVSMQRVLMHGAETASTIPTGSAGSLPSE